MIFLNKFDKILNVKTLYGIYADITKNGAVEMPNKTDLSFAAVVISTH